MTDEASKLMKDFNLKPGPFKVLGAFFAIPAGVALALFLYFIAAKLNYPLWLKFGLSAFALLLLYEGFAMLLKPISFSFNDGIFRAGYLISNFKFALTDIESYRTLSYPTRYGIKDGVIIKLRNNRVLEINEVLINGKVSVIKDLFEEHKILRSSENNPTLWMTRFPKRFES